MKKILYKLAKHLKFISPDVLSILGVLFSIIAAICFGFAFVNPVLLLWATLFVIARIFVNEFEWVTISVRESITLRGKILNALPDRYSDIVIIIGLAVTPLCGPLFALFGLATMFLISYTGLLGKALEVDWQNQGPLGKNRRLLLLILFAIIQFFTLANNYSLNLIGIQWTPLQWCMVLYLILGQLTVVNRIWGMYKQSIKYEWLKDEKYKEINAKILIAYDSKTGNTERVAEEISNCLKVGIRRIEDISSVENYDLVIFGSRDAGNRPSSKVMELLKEHQGIKNYAIFITYSNPWRELFAWVRFAYFRKLLNKKPLAVFSCRAAYKEEELYQDLSTDENLLNAFLFGVKISRKLAKLNN